RSWVRAGVAPRDDVLPNDLGGDLRQQAVFRGGVADWPGGSLRSGAAPQCVAFQVGLVDAAQARGAPGDDERAEGEAPVDHPGGVVGDELFVQPELHIRLWEEPTRQDQDILSGGAALAGDDLPGAGFAGG